MTIPSNPSRPERRNERGAALTETVVVVPVFIILLAGMLFFHQTVAKMQRSMLAARRDAWTRAIQGCRDGPLIQQPNMTSLMPGAAGVLASFLSSVGKTPGESSDTAKVSVLAATPGPVAQAEGLTFSTDIHSRVIVTCNTLAEPGDLPGVLDWFLNRGEAMWPHILRP
jgi:Flp pilus assembly protein TadG